MKKTLTYNCSNCGREYKLTIKREKVTDGFFKTVGVKYYWIPLEEVKCCENPQPIAVGKERREK